MKLSAAILVGALTWSAWAYAETEINGWQHWKRATAPDASAELPRKVQTGSVRKGHMEGHWTAQDKFYRGEGDLKAGNGAWQSFYIDGDNSKPLARGNIKNDLPEGPWTLFHRNGQVAATGNFKQGVRDGAWTFFFDDEAHTKLATGTFKKGALVGVWQHFGPKGELIATTEVRTPKGWRGNGHLLTVLNLPAGMHRQVHQDEYKDDARRLETLWTDQERIYVFEYTDPKPEERTIYIDQDGNRLRKRAKGWTAAACSWDASEKQTARKGDLIAFHASIATAPGQEEAPQRYCDKEIKTTPERSARIEALVAAADADRIPPAEFMRDYVISGFESAAKAAERKANLPDLMQILDNAMGVDIEVAHIDQPFIRLFATLPGYQMRD